MDQSKRFESALNKLDQFKRPKVSIIIEKLKGENPDLDNTNFIAILDKLHKKDISYMDISASKYMKSVDIWNQFILDSKENFDLLISGEDLVF